MPVKNPSPQFVDNYFLVVVMCSSIVYINALTPLTMILAEENKKLGLSKHFVILIRYFTTEMVLRGQESPIHVSYLCSLLCRWRACLFWQIKTGQKLKKKSNWNKK